MENIVKNNYLLVSVVLLIISMYIMFCKDAMTEYFENQSTQVGQCMNLYSRNQLNSTGINVLYNQGERSAQSCPPNICTFDANNKKCIPNRQHADNALIQNYCLKEQYLENMSEMEMCNKLGYTWENNKCNSSHKRNKDDCPQNVCQWEAKNNKCIPKSVEKLYNVNDYDSVADYCQHLKSLSPLVTKETCKSMGSAYDWNVLLGKCLNVNINKTDTFDNCWGRDERNKCLDKTDKTGNCLWMPNMTSVDDISDIKQLRDIELNIIEKEVNDLDSKLRHYIDSAGQYDNKLSTEQSAKLVQTVLDNNETLKYKLEQGIKQFVQPLSQT
jgi:hypothetical protein